MHTIDTIVDIKEDGTIIVKAPKGTPLGKRRIRVVIDPVDDPDAALAADLQAGLWKEWVDSGPQGPIELENDRDFP